jgi:hypothetical protein
MHVGQFRSIMVARCLWLEDRMGIRVICFGLALIASSVCARAAGGLAAPDAEALWPRWQLRINLQTVTPLAVNLAQQVDLGALPTGLQGGALFGEYYFARPSFGNFRARGGLVTGWQGGAPLASMGDGSPLRLALNGGAGWYTARGAEGPGTFTYLGLGYSGQLWHNSLSISADVGMIAESAAATWGVGHAIFGNQGLDSVLHDMHLSPTLQLGVSYRF